jgi:hypothetical protein
MRVPDGEVLNSVMNDFPSSPIGDFENTLSFPSEETSFASGLLSHLPWGDVPCQSSPSQGFLHQKIEALKTQYDFGPSRFLGYLLQAGFG